MGADFKERLRKLIPPGIVVALIAYSIVGFPWEKQPTGKLPQGGWIVDILGQRVEHPFLLVFLIGTALGYWILPWIIELFTRKKNCEHFKEKIVEMGDYRISFFEYLGIAYNSYFKDSVNDHNEFLDSLEYPEWLDGTSEDLLRDTQENITNEAMPWNFFFQLYSAIEDARTHKDFRVESDFGLHGGRHNELHRMRQRLVDFWDDVGKQVASGRLRYKVAKQEIREHERLIKALAFMSLGVFIKMRQKGGGARSFYYLCSRYFKEEMWRRANT